MGFRWLARAILYLVAQRYAKLEPGELPDPGLSEVVAPHQHGDSDGKECDGPRRIHDGLFMEVHDNPAKALSDGPNALKLSLLPGLLEQLIEIRKCLKKTSRP